MNPMNDHKILDKIEKLMRLAKSDNQHEAELAMQRAQEMMLKHGIDAHRLNPHLEKKAFLRDDFDLGMKRVPVCHNEISRILIDFFDVRIVNLRGTSSISIIGREEKVATAKVLYTFLNETFQRLWRKFSKATGISPKHGRASYFIGLERGLKDKLEEQRQATLREEFDNLEDLNKYKMVLVGEKDQLAIDYKQFFSRLTSTTRKYRHNDDAINQGYHDGKRINLNPQLV